MTQSQAQMGEVWRWPNPTCPIVVLILETPAEGGRSQWHDVLVLDIDEDEWPVGARGVRWTVSSTYGWERLL